MTTHNNPYFTALLVVFSGLFLAGCQTVSTGPTIDTRSIERRALAASESGDLRAAADLYLQLAGAHSGSSRVDFLLSAANLEIDLNNFSTAAELISKARENATPVQLAQTDISLARIALAEGRPSDALVLATPLVSSDNDAVRISALEQLGLAQFAMDRPIDAVNSLNEREVWLDTNDSIRANQFHIWSGLQRSSLLSASSGDETIDGWLALGPIAKIFDDEQQRRALIEWRSANRRHPAARVLVRDLLADSGATLAAPRQIAVLLPLTSSAREFARAIQDGFIAAHMAKPQPMSVTASELTPTVSDLQQPQSRVRFYDTSIEGAAAAYLRAELDGADFIVGPLLRSAVEEILPQTGLIPTLTLNYSLSAEDAITNTYQFALSPEDEAIASARRAISLNQNHAVALVPSNDRGYRILNSFRKEYETLGGEVLAFAGFDEVTRTYSDRVITLLNLDRSNQRHRRLEANLGTNIESEPRRRQDIDMIFVAANAETGRMLVPQLEYFYAGDIPTYGISEIYNPSNNNVSADLNGIIFPDIPWVIAPDELTTSTRRTISTHWPLRNASQLTRYFGFGFDAYNIVQGLYRNPFFTAIDGVTGKLSMDIEGRIRRSLPFAQIRGNTAQLIPDSVLLPSSTDDEPLESDKRKVSPDLFSSDTNEVNLDSQ